jgi:hypothetical protein
MRRLMLPGPSGDLELGVGIQLSVPSHPDPP